MSDPLRVLLLEDVKSDAELALRELRQLQRALDFRRVETREEFLRALVEFHPDLILSDFSMPDAFDGLMALDLARSQAPGVPFVFVSGTIGEDRAIDALRRGATDYVVKDRLSRLVPVCLRALQEADERAGRRRAEQWRDGQNRILESIATGALLAESLRQLVLTMESQSPGMLCSILLINTDGTHLRTGASPSLPEVYNRAIDGLPAGPHAGSCGTAAWRGEQVIVTDIAADPLWKDYRELAAAHGLRACWSTPILSRDGTLLGTFANYFRVPREPSPAELELAASATHIARIAIEKRRDETEILRAKERLDLALEASGVALWDTDVPSQRVYLSEHWAAMLGYDARATVTTIGELAHLAHPDDRRTLLELSTDIALGRRASYDAEYRVAARNGEWRWILSRGKVMERTHDGRAVRVIGTSVDITATKHDSLTDLPNRALFIDRARQGLLLRGNEQPMLALVLADLERFRNVNETFGRGGGDELLRRVARRLEEAFQGKDFLARLGPDTFGVVVRDVRDVHALAHVVESRLLGCFREPFGLRGTELRVAARAGIAMYPADGNDADTLYKNAEAALKKARDSGEQYLFYAADMNARAAHALSLENRLRKAVEEQQFVLHYQPKIDLATDEICGLEALIRWDDPETGLVPPLQFIPLLEETGMILEVGRWVIGRALSQRAEWRAAGLNAPRIAVNVSALQLQQRDFADIVINAVRLDGGPAALEVELTESLLMRDVQASIARLSALREEHIPIAMDDFGTGYSSLSYIARLPINSVKIDRSFIVGMAGGPQDMAIVTTIIALAHSLNLKVTAEGVETGEQARLLKLLRCDEAQGYLYSKPVPAAEIEAMLPVAARQPG